MKNKEMVFLTSIILHHIPNTQTKEKNLFNCQKKILIPHYIPSIMCILLYAKHALSYWISLG